MDPEKIGIFIKKLRTENKFSQNDLAKMIPIGREAISKWENGKTIPDSQNLVILSKIFKVTIDELMAGENITKANKNNHEDLLLKIYDRKNYINEKLKKRTKILVASLILLFLAITSFLFYYFFNSYDSVKVYTIESNSQEDIYLTDGIIVLTGENIYFRLGNINGIEENKISTVELYYDYKDSKKKVYKSNNVKDVIIKDYYGYNEYFEIKNKELKLDSLYVDFTIEDEIKTIKLIITEDYSNKRLFFRRDQQSYIKESQKVDNDINSEIMEMIKNKFEYIESSEGYVYELNYKNITYMMGYFEISNELSIFWSNKNINYSFRYDLISEEVFYNEQNMSHKDIESCEFDINNSQSNTCDKKTTQHFFELINQLKRISA